MIYMYVEALRMYQNYGLKSNLPEGRFSFLDI